MKLAVVIFIYSNGIKYINDLVLSLNNQTNFDFKVIIFNDDVIQPGIYFQKLKLEYTIINLLSKSPMDLRYEGLELLKFQKFDYYIFQDCDDLMDFNRVEVIRNLSKKYKLISNDLTLINSSGKIISEKIWKTRLNKKIFTYREIQNSNFVGLGNTSFNSKLLNYIPIKPKINLTAVDWHLFYSILKESKVKGFFSSNTTTLYRQHDENSIGIIDNSNSCHIIETRKTFFNLCDIDEDLLEKNDIKQIKNHNNFPFWWELK